MTKVFLDTDVILDFLLDRQPFSQRAGMIFALGEHGRLRLSTSTISFLNVHYIAASQRNGKEARALVRRLRTLISLIAVNETTIDSALAVDTRDLEDAVQFISARQARMDFIITRNVGDFPKDQLPVLSPEVFLNTIPQSTPETD